MGGFDDLIDRLEALLAELEELDEPVRSTVFELLDGIDALHRSAMASLGEALGPAASEELRTTSPPVAWLFEAYGVGVDQRRAAEEALEAVRPYIYSHGGTVDVVDAAAGVVRLRLSGSCSGCTASAVTLKEHIEGALRDGVPGFAAIEVEEDDAPAHPPPVGPVPVELTTRPR